MENSIQESYRLAHTAYKERKFQKAYRAYLDLSDQEDPGVFLILGWMTQVGRGVPVSLDEAREWYCRARESDLTGESDFRIGVIEEILHNYSSSIENFIDSSGKGYLPALYRLSIVRDRLKPNDGETVLRSAAERGHVFANFRLSLKEINFSYGLSQFFVGVKRLTKSIKSFVYIALKDRFDQRLIRN